MTFPPPPHERPSSSPGGGFGPPPDLGMPDAAAPVAGGVFGPPPAPFGPGAGGPPPGGDGGDRAPRIAAFFIGAVLVVGLGVGGLLIVTSDGPATADAGRRPAPAKTSPTPAPPRGGAGATEPPSDTGAPGGPAPPPSDAPGEELPFVALGRGVCFDHPELDPGVRKVVERPCTGPHDGEVIGNRELTGDFASDQELETEALRLCGSDVKRRMRDIPDDGRQYYNYALYPSLPTYQTEGENRVSCALTLSDGPGGRKLTAALP
ncbi:hypothetical protein [Streptomyces meridianus]|uniref:Septum formation-related domain-containing protein n=1 Tax=Streptomyces meridianus TaxID=2938945 RepID=A0ABT0X2R4_9ACTN|nr:hypothetical protein [Streptomyces meridianus]MCM2576500.1 hypothetical protein [Streptomyces meridianus]